MTKLPLRHPNHSLEYKSELFLRNHLPSDWILDKPTDYGIDFKIDIVKNNQVIGQNFSVQLKAHERLGKGKPVTATLERSTINLYLTRLEPILIICYICEQQEAYYSWFTESSVDLTKNQQSHTLKFDPRNKLSELNWDIISKKVDEIFSRRALLHGFPEFNFFEMGEAEKEAASHYLSQDYETAGFLYKQLQKKNPSGCWLNAIAMCHYSLYQYKDALTYINKALAVADLIDIRLNKASILAEFGMESSNKAMVLEASNLFKTAIDEYGDSSQHFNYANTLGWLGENELAKKHYSKVLKLNPNYAEAWKNLGEIYFRTKNPLKEIQCYDNALMINPNLPQALMCKGMALIRDQKQYEQGLTYLNRAFTVDADLFSKYASGYFWFAHANFKTGNTDKALKYLDEGLEHNPGEPYLLNLKRDYFKDNWKKSEQLESAAKTFLLYRLELEPEDAISLECLCRIYLNQGDRLSMIGLLRKYTVLLRKSSINELASADFDMEPYLDSLYNYHHYCQFRHLHPLEKDVSLKTATTFYFEFTELIGLKMFHECLSYIRAHKTDHNFEKNLFDNQFKQAEQYYPLSAPYAITASTVQKDQFSKQMCSAMVHIPILAIREIGRINGYLTVKFKLNDRKMNQAISDSKENESNQKMLLECLTQIQQRYHFLPEGD